jgi:hypothetical protein
MSKGSTAVAADKKKFKKSLTGEAPPKAKLVRDF